MQYGSSTRKYSPTVRRFCFTVSYYSPKAYDYIREIFSQNLPTARTLRSWYSSVDGSPGFTEASFNALKHRAEIYNTEGRKLTVCLIHDAMWIRQHSQWDHASKKFLGHNMTRDTNANAICLPLASYALVLMVCGIDGDFKIPIGYFLNNGTKTDELADIITEAMFRLSNVGVQLASMTYDGATENIAAAKALGATLENPYIINRFDSDNKVYVILDVPHMLKLVRNCLGNKKILYYQDGKVEWKFITDLINLQMSENINLGNKLKKTHAEFHDKKMNVRLAAETISDSTAASIEYLDEHMANPNFKNSKNTIEMLRVFNNLFDTMNTKLNHCNEGYKRPFSKETIADFTSFFTYAKTYINDLKIEDHEKIVPILKSRSFTPFFDFLQNIESFKGIYTDYFVKYGQDTFYTFAASQDHIETFFGCIRRMNGCNDNPSEQQFSAAYKKLLFQNEITSSPYSNCQNDVTKILTVPSGKKEVSKSDNQCKHDLELLANYDSENPDMEMDCLGTSDNIKLQNHARAYLASIVEFSVVRKIARRKNNKCIKCLNVFVENEIADDEFIAYKFQNGSVYQPCKSTLSIIHSVEKLLKRYESQEVSYDATVTHILRNIDICQLYQLSEFNDEHDHDHEHKCDLIKLIVEAYLDKKSTYVSQLVTRLSQKKLIRHEKLKDIHIAGQ